MDSIFITNLANVILYIFLAGLGWFIGDALSDKKEEIELKEDKGLKEETVYLQTINRYTLDKEVRNSVDDIIEELKGKLITERKVTGIAKKMEIKYIPSLTDMLENYQELETTDNEEIKKELKNNMLNLTTLILAIINNELVESKEGRIKSINLKANEILSVVSLDIEKFS